jgi:nitroreductase
MHAWPANSPGLFAPELLRTWFVALDVRGLPPGSYALRDSPCRLIESSRGDYANQLLHLGLGQEIFVDAAGALIHTVDLPRAIRLLGDRAYRLVTLDAGHIGERLNLALLREGLGVSGCGGYLDDEMNRVLGIPENQAVVYITVLGVPAEPA